MLVVNRNVEKKRKKYCFDFLSTIFYVLQKNNKFAFFFDLCYNLSMGVKNNVLFLQTKMDLAGCLKKVANFLHKGISTENLFWGKLFLRNDKNFPHPFDKLNYDYFCHGVFAKLKSSKRGDYYIYLHKDAEYCRVLSNNMNNPICHKAFVVIEKLFKPASNLDIFKERVNAEFIKILNEKLEEYAIFGEYKEDNFYDEYQK